jgi:signal transduction histidine kinase
LRPVILDDLGLPASLEWLADRLIAETDAEVKITIDDEMPALSAEVELTIFRITQEALANVRRHARAREVRISLGSVGGQIRLTISNNGAGFIVPKHPIEAASFGKWGLITMQERAQLLGGTLALRSVLGKGTVVMVNLPLGNELNTERLP